MCGGVKYTDVDGKEWKIYFPYPKAALPIAKPVGQVEWIRWGRRKKNKLPLFKADALGQTLLKWVNGSVTSL